MTPAEPSQARCFLFLQGPHGPFFQQLARQLRASGARCLRVGFNAGDSVFWRDRADYIPYRGTLEDWPERFASILRDEQVTDLVLYGDVRPVHSTVLEHARARGLAIHIFEEGYLRPYWVTYERDGSNGHSRLMQMSIPQIQERLATQHFDAPVPPGHWGDLQEHVFYGALYHWFVLFWNQRYPRFRPHRELHVSQEFGLYLKRLLLMPFHALDRLVATWRIRSGSFPYHLALLQLEHDSSFQAHGPFKGQAEFVTAVVDGFAKGAPPHHHLVFKAHPLENGRTPLRRTIRDLAKAKGIATRVHFVGGGKLAALMTDARSAVTVNSTAGQQALWRGIPLRAFGASVYSKPELTSDQPLDRFFADPSPPDRQAYRCFRDFLLSTSQVPGSYYAGRGRRQVVRLVTDMMLSAEDPYALPKAQSEALGQQLRLVR